MFGAILPEIRSFEIIILLIIFSLVISGTLFILLQYRKTKRKIIELRAKSDLLKEENILIRSQLEEAKKQADRKTTFLANASHEIRTPLHAIYGFAELLSDKNLSDSEKVDYREMIIRNSNTLLSIVNDIIDIVRIEKGLMTISREEVNVNYFIDDVDHFIKKELRLFNKDHIKISPVKYYPDESASFKIDPKRLRQIMINLIGNALKFTHEGFIEFGYKLLDKEILLFYVSDSGIGIEKEYQENIFNEFTQINPLDLKARSVSGLGLTISKKLVEIMGGKIWVESVPNSGSTFYFTVPFEENLYERKLLDEKQEDFQEGCWANHTILIVDDYKDIYYYFSEVLVHTGIRFLYAENGIRAIELCKQHQEIELVLMDIQMPEMSGIEATENIRSFRKKLPIIAQTAYAQTEDIDLFLDAGFNDLITKPIEKKVLLQKMSKYLNRLT